MIEIRPIVDSESEAFLEILCDVFELTYERVQGVFYSEPFFDLDRKWAAFDAGRMVSVLTTVPLTFGWGPAIGIAGVATVAESRGLGFASKLVRFVTEQSRKSGEPAALLFAKDQRIYASCGFDVLDEVVQADIEFHPLDPDHRLLGQAEVEAIYTSWAAQDPWRLRRDERRWKYWRWHLRLCQAMASGYVCHEGATIREVVSIPPSLPIRSNEPSRWSGLRSVSNSLQLPLISPETTMFLMGRGIAEAPQMFLTDQF